MSDANFASLSSTLLARKGGAKPAMRPQSGIPGPVDGKEAAANLEDLGWNDMGQNGEDAQTNTPKGGAEVVAIHAKAKPSDDAKDLDADCPLVQRQQRLLAEQFLEKTKAAPKKSARVSRKKSTPGKGAKRAAFTLRLDPDRHLKLKLASTMHGISAQALVTEALDAMLSEIEDLEQLASQLQRN